ncbi:MAG: glycosyltransferase, partial [Solirubrobacterales bacterium]
MTELSVVIPVYGCEDCLHALHARVRAALGEVTDDSEIVFVEDRSPDESWRALREIAAADSRVKLLRLSRNFGQHAAITAGLAAATGAWVVVMDCDLQDPPEEIPTLFAKGQEGFDVVLA